MMAQDSHRCQCETETIKQTEEKFKIELHEYNITHQPYDTTLNI